MSRVLFAIVVIVALSGAALAQTTGIIRGQVTDESGAMVPLATVAVSTAKGVVKQITAGADGSYVVTGLAYDTYTVLAAASSSKSTATRVMGKG